MGRDLMMMLLEKMKKEKRTAFGNTTQRKEEQQAALEMNSNRIIKKKVKGQTKSIPTFCRALFTKEPHIL